jgi:hypothetical protein
MLGDKEARALLGAIELNSDYRYAELTSDGVVRHLISHIEIPRTQIPYVPQEAGYYRLGENTCSGTCKIGQPAKACLEKGGMYTPTKCAVYTLWPANQGSIPMDQLRPILDAYINLLAKENSDGK